MIAQDLIDQFQIKKNFSIAENTWFGVGGKFDYFYKARNLDDLCSLLKELNGSIPIFIIGNTSNLLISDHGFRGIVIKPHFVSLTYDPNLSIVKAGSSVLDVNLSKFALENSIKSLEFLNTIPGSIGGGIAMNAGCYGGEFQDIIIDVKAVDFRGNISILKNHNELKFDYRHCNLKDLIFVEAIIKAEPGNRDEILSKMDSNQNNRLATQPVNLKTGGSSFRNPTSTSAEALKAWQLIDKVGMRGFRIGGACFSQKHSNFITNDLGATANDIFSLIHEAKKRALNVCGIHLKEEIALLGSFEINAN